MKLWATLPAQFAADPDNIDGHTWHPVMIAGDWKHTGRDFPVTEKDLENHIALFNAGKLGPKLPVFLGHPKKAEQEAVGWMYEFRHKDKGTLEARIGWVGNTKDDIKKGKYAFFSPEFFTRWTDNKGEKQKFALFNVALLNKQHLKELPEVAANFEAVVLGDGLTFNEGPRLGHGDQEMDELKKALTENAKLMAENKAQAERIVKLESEAAEGAKFAEDLKGERAKFEELHKQHEELKAKNEEMTEKARTEKAWSDVHAAFADGKITSKEAYGEHGKEKAMEVEKIEDRSFAFRQAYSNPAEFAEGIALRPKLKNPETNDQGSTTVGKVDTSAGDNYDPNTLEVNVDRENTIVKMADDLQAQAKKDGGSLRYEDSIATATAMYNEGKRAV